MLCPPVERARLVHDVLRPPHQEHIGMACLGDAMAAADQFDRVDVLRAKQPRRTPIARRPRRSSASPIVVARHLEDHGHGGHGGTSAAADHRGHPDDRTARNADPATGRWNARAWRRSCRRW